MTYALREGIGPSSAAHWVTSPLLAGLMGRMGHSTTRAALIYQHRTAERDRLIAAAISRSSRQS
jgi:hypothetical protein